MANNPDLSALAAFPGTYQMALFRRLFNSFDAVNDLTLYSNVKNSLIMHKLITKNGPKPYTGVLISKGDDIGYQPHILTVEKFQRDIVIEPAKYRTTFMANQRGPGENANNKTIPFAQFTWETIMMDMASQLNDATYIGVGKAAFTAGDGATAYNTGALKSFVIDNEVRYFRANQAITAGQTPAVAPQKWDDWNAMAIFEGFGPKIANLITLGAGAGGLDPVTTGIISSTSGAYDQFKKLWRSQSVQIKNSGATIFCSYNDYEILTDDFENKISKFTETDNGITYLSTTNKKCIIKPVTWLTNSRRLICTKPENMIIGTDLLSDMNNIATEEHPYTIDAGITGVLGVQVRDPEALRVSDQV
jgi:hypothetical protein